MWLMLQQDEPDDYVIATGETHTVKEFVELAFRHVGLNWQDYVILDKQFYRPTEKYELRGDFSKANQKLGWQPIVNFDDLVKIMVDDNLKKIKQVEV